MNWTKLVWLAFMALPCAHASLREEQIDLPVAVNDAYGKAITQTIKVTIFSDDSNPQPAPVLVLNHGRAPDAESRSKLNRVRYTDASRFLVQRLATQNATHQPLRLPPSRRWLYWQPCASGPMSPGTGRW